MEQLYEIIRRPIITEKGLGVKETQHTVVFEVARSHQDADQGSRAARFNVKVDDVRTAIYHGKLRRRGRPKASAATGRKRTSSWRLAKR